MRKSSLAIAAVAVLAIAFAANRIVAPTGDATVTRAYQAKGPLDWVYLPAYHQDVSDGAPCYVVDNGVARLVIGTETAGNNGCGSFRPGWPVDFGLPYGNFHEGLDWTEWTLQERMDATWNHSGKWLDLGDIRVEGRDVVARGQWAADAKVKAEARYTLLPGAPVARIALSLRNETDDDLSLFFQYLLDYDHGSDAYIPGVGWNANFVSRVPADNYIYAGRRDGRLTGYGIAWHDTQPSGVVAAGHVAGVWFDASMKAGKSRTLVFYHIAAADGGRRATERVADWAHRIAELDPKVNPRALVRGTVTDGRGRPVAGALVFARNADGQLVGRTLAAENGRYVMGLDGGSYTLQASLPGYEVAARSVRIADVARRGAEPAPYYRLSFAIPRIDGVWLGVGKRLRGILASGSTSDTVLENEALSLCIATATRVSPLGPAAIGKPLDLACAGGEDTLLGMDALYVAAAPPAGEDAWKQASVVNKSVRVTSSSPERVVLRAEGAYALDGCITVSTEYALERGMPWVSLESTLANDTGKPARLFIGDVLASGAGAAALLPGVGVVAGKKEPAAYKPAEPWLAHFSDAPQVVGIDYVVQPAGLTFYGIPSRMMSVVPLTLPPGGTFTLKRHLICVPTSNALAPDLAMAQAQSKLRLHLGGLDVAVTPAADEVSVGAALGIRVAVRNTGSAPVGPVRLRLDASESLAVAGEAEQTVESIEPGRAAAVRFRVSGVQAGFGMLAAFVATASTEYPGIPARLFVNGPGWYRGDTHTHTLHSDGAGRVADNVAAAVRAGLSFLVITDHNTVLQAEDFAREERPGFFTLLGQEVTCSYGHANALLIQKLVDASLPAQKMVDSARAQGGLLFINHPFYPGLEWGPWDLRNVTGIEVWNGFYAPDHEVNARAFAAWEDQLNQGKRLAGMASSDAHNPGKVGSPHVCAYLEALTPDAVRLALSKGRFYGTNGPALSFEVNGTPMGSGVRVRSGEKARLAIGAGAEKPLKKVVLIRNGSVLTEWIPGGNSFEATIEEEPGKGAWYRVTVSADGGGFAFSNPIWVNR